MPPSPCARRGHAKLGRGKGWGKFVIRIKEFLTFAPLCKKRKTLAQAASNNNPPEKPKTGTEDEAKLHQQIKWHRKKNLL
jgi:hypothetical protein